jgi:hypothetical protein
MGRVLIGKLFVNGRRCYLAVVSSGNSSVSGQSSYNTWMEVSFLVWIHFFVCVTSFFLGQSSLVGFFFGGLRHFHGFFRHRWLAALQFS